MNVPVRTLPIRVPPMPGEALDSWLEALATRLDTPLTHMLDALGLSRHDRASRAGPPPNWTIHLTQHEAAHLGAATGVSPQTLRGMTLSRWAGHFLTLDPTARTVNVRSSWTRARGSRYCPLCLAETGGRWQLTWRLTWHFACLDHGVLLQARCGDCGRMPRELGHALSSVPVPGRCSLPRLDVAKRATARPAVSRWPAATRTPATSMSSRFSPASN
ncbi:MULTISPECIES: TniQ family protein [unclassified Nonomuraea]|uniref:TniQ family protein n=1 Tax=unclassified Nonomuraea TaxID=2593643 RepID=UPI0033F9670C